MLVPGSRETNLWPCEKLSMWYFKWTCQPGWRNTGRGKFTPTACCSQDVSWSVRHGKQSITRDDHVHKGNVALITATPTKDKRYSQIDLTLSPFLSAPVWRGNSLIQALPCYWSIILFPSVQPKFQVNASNETVALAYFTLFVAVWAKVIVLLRLWINKKLV